MKKLVVVTGLFLLVALVSLLIISRNNRNRDLTDILKDGRLTVLINSGEHGFTRDSLKVNGFQYEVIKKYADELGVELVILHEPDHEQGNDELLKGDCDVIVSLQPFVADSTLDVVSLVPLIETNLMLVQRTDSSGKRSISTQYELDTKTITVTKASPYKVLINNLSDDLAIDPLVIESEYLSLDALVNAVAQGKIEYAVCPGHLVTRLAGSYPTVDMTLPLTFHLQLGWTIRKSSVVLQDNLNSFLSNFVGTAEYWTLYNSYFVN